MQKKKKKQQEVGGVPSSRRLLRDIPSPSFPTFQIPDFGPVDDAQVEQMQQVIRNSRTPTPIAIPDLPPAAEVDEARLDESLREISRDVRASETRLERRVDRALAKASNARRLSSAPPPPLQQIPSLVRSSSKEEEEDAGKLLAQTLEELDEDTLAFQIRRMEKQVSRLDSGGGTASSRRIVPSLISLAELPTPTLDDCCISAQKDAAVVAKLEAMLLEEAAIKESAWKAVGAHARWLTASIAGTVVDATSWLSTGATGFVLSTGARILVTGTVQNLTGGNAVLGALAQTFVVDVATQIPSWVRDPNGRRKAATFFMGMGFTASAGSIGGAVGGAYGVVAGQIVGGTVQALWVGRGTPEPLTVGQLQAQATERLILQEDARIRSQLKSSEFLRSMSPADVPFWARHKRRILLSASALGAVGYALAYGVPVPGNGSLVSSAAAWLTPAFMFRAYQATVQQSQWANAVASGAATMAATSVARVIANFVNRIVDRILNLHLGGNLALGERGVDVPLYVPVPEFLRNWLRWRILERTVYHLTLRQVSHAMVGVTSNVLLARAGQRAFEASKTWQSVDDVFADAQGAYQATFDLFVAGAAAAATPAVASGGAPIIVAATTTTTEEERFDRAMREAAPTAVLPPQSTLKDAPASTPLFAQPQQHPTSTLLANPLADLAGRQPRVVGDTAASAPTLAAERAERRQVAREAATVFKEAHRLTPAQEAQQEAKRVEAVAERSVRREQAVGRARQRQTLKAAKTASSQTKIKQSLVQKAFQEAVADLEEEHPTLAGAAQDVEFYGLGWQVLERVGTPAGWLRTLMQTKKAVNAGISSIKTARAGIAAAYVVAPEEGVLRDGANTMMRAGHNADRAISDFNRKFSEKMAARTVPMPSATAAPAPEEASSIAASKNLALGVASDVLAYARGGDVKALHSLEVHGTEQLLAYVGLHPLGKDWKGGLADMMAGEGINAMIGQAWDQELYRMAPELPTQTFPDVEL